MLSWLIRYKKLPKMLKIIIRRPQVVADLAKPLPHAITCLTLSWFRTLIFTIIIDH
jgi:hypothetical protein